MDNLQLDLSADIDSELLHEVKKRTDCGCLLHILDPDFLNSIPPFSQLCSFKKVLQPGKGRPVMQPGIDVEYHTPDEMIL